MLNPTTFRSIAGLIFFAGLIPNSLEAKIMTGGSHKGVRAGIDFFSIQEPSLSRTQRLQYRFEWRDVLLGQKNIRFDAAVKIAPDTKEKSKDLILDHDFYFFSGTACYEYVKFFRFSIGAGPFISLERTYIEILGDTEESTAIDYGISGKIDIDYSFSQEWELSVNVTGQNRSKADKIDWGYGIGAGYNL